LRMGNDAPQCVPDPGFAGLIIGGTKIVLNCSPVLKKAFAAMRAAALASGVAQRLRSRRSVPPASQRNVSSTREEWSECILHQAAISRRSIGDQTRRTIGLDLPGIGAPSRTSWFSGTICACTQ